MRIPRSEVISAATGSGRGGGTVAGAGQAADQSGSQGGSATVAGDLGALGGGPAGVASGSSGTGTGAASRGGSASSSGQAAGAAVSAGSRAANLSPVVIGTIGEYTGAVGATIGPGKPMVPIDVAWINAHGGLNGHPIKLIQADDQSDPSRYLSLAKDMVENQHAIAFLANLVPLSAPGADSYLTQKGIPVVGGDGAHALWGQSPDMFFAGTTFKNFAPAVAQIGVKEGKPKIAVIYCVEADPCQTYGAAFLHDPRVQQVGGQVVYAAQVSLAQPDFTSECIQAQNHGAQIIAMALDANSISRVGRSCSGGNFRPQYFTSSLGIVGALAQDPNLNGIQAPVGTFPWVANDLPDEQDYHSAIRQFNPGMVESAASSAVWVAGLLLKAATTNLPANNPTSADIMNGVLSIKNSLFGGLIPQPVTFVKGQPSPDMACYFQIQLQGGSWAAPKGSKTDCL
jgi:branched-chain amino acid transport system substrate-binding protein